MRVCFIFVSFFFIYLPYLGAEERLFLMPRDHAAALGALIHDIDSAKTEISGAIYSFTHRDIAKAIKRAASRGVNVYLLMDAKSNLKNTHSRIGDVAKIRNIEVRTLSGLPAKKGNYFGKMHMKVLVIDGKKAYFGSANWSNSAFGLNYESLHFSDHPEIVTIYHEGIMSLFAQGKPY